MSEARDQGETLELLAAALDTFGADASRWPAAVRPRLTAFVESNAEAQRRVMQARALDKVLGFAPRLSEARHAELVEKIVTRAASQPRMAAGNAQPLVRQRFEKWRSNSLPAAALAASLVLGIFAGQNTTVGSLANAIVNGSGAAASANQQVAQTDGTDSLLEEDLL